MSENDPPTEHAVIAFSQYGGGTVLFADGEAIEAEVEATNGMVYEMGIGDDDIPGAGIWVWEGNAVLSKADGGDFVSEYFGIWREPSDKEWACIKMGESPWGPAGGEVVFDADANGGEGGVGGSQGE